MGVTHFEIKILESILSSQEITDVIELGAQNNYATQETKKPPFMSEWYNKKNIRYYAIDLAGDNGSIQVDLSNPLNEEIIVPAIPFDMVTDFGTSEHVVQMHDYAKVQFHDGHINSIYPVGPTKDIKMGYYNCWLNKHRLLKIGGVMVNVNPLTRQWPGHGYSYLGENFYNELIKVSGYSIMEQGINCAMGNCETGINLYSILKKTSEEFPRYDQFYKLPIFEY